MDEDLTPLDNQEWAVYWPFNHDSVSSRHNYGDICCRVGDQVYHNGYGLVCCWCRTQWLTK